MKKLFPLVTLIFLLSLIVACAKPLPQDKLDYAGVWESENMYLVINPDGNLSYKRRQGVKTTEINAPVKEFIGDDFTSGIGGLTTTFKVSQPPHQVDGQWQMVVDDVLLVRTRTFSTEQ